MVQVVDRGIDLGVVHADVRRRQPRMFELGLCKRPSRM